MKKTLSLIAIAFFAFCSSLNYNIFVFPNTFAPAGLDGIFTMIQDITNINIGYYTLVANIPLLIAAFFCLNHDFAIKNAVFIVSFSLSSIFFKHIDISSFRYITDTGTSIVLAPVAAGVIRGILYVFTLNLNGAAGGIDIMASLVKKRVPHLNFMSIVFGFNMLVALSAYFVYGMRLEPVICSIIYSFITSMVSTKLRSGKNETVKFEIITPYAEELCHDISDKLQQTATIIDAHGAYTGADTKMVICVVKKEKSLYVEKLILEHPGCVVFKSTVSNSITGIAYN